jgi:DNA repair photolyase
MNNTFNGWNKQEIKDNQGKIVQAITPVIISASRATDIPAFFSEWFINRLKEGYLIWTNPFNRKQRQYISLKDTRVVVFWSKNPYKLIPLLPELDNRNINYYFQFTLNDYENEKLEPNVINFKKRIDIFKSLSDKIGKDKIIWRFDPLILTDNISIESLLRKIEKIGNKIHNYTSKLVFSFADISQYRKVQRNLSSVINYFEFETFHIEAISKELQELNKHWKLDLATCAEIVDLEKYGIKHNRCIDDELMIKLFKEDNVLMNFLGYKDKDEQGLFNILPSKKNLKDKGQRKSCGCIVSKDIGHYDTCSHLCVYCYANSSKTAVINNIKKIDINNSSLIN